LTALVDSGADRPIFDSEAAEVLALDLSNAPPWPFSGTTGELQIARLARVSITILKENGVDHAFEMTAECAFCDSFKFSGGALLGQIGFFSQFKATFHQPNNFFELEPLRRSVIGY
jgi:hypothetical protein